ncbi:hypothetical protein BGZ67_004630 [Mortierella alpina]|nr:hypothetical protein BGZ67_004630 [Mortierella alpina]
MLSALSHTSISTTPVSGPMAQQPPSDITPSSSINTRDSLGSHSESSAMAEDTTDDQVNGSMDYSIETPIHPLASGPRSPPSHSSSYTATPQHQQHQQLVKLKSEHGLAPSSQHAALNKPDVVMAGDDADGEAAPMESDPHDDSASQERIPLVVDTSPNVAPHGSSTFAGNRAPQIPMSSPNAASTPTPDSGATAPSSSRRGSLRTMPATLPRSALQEETIALFKQYRHLIPCAKCFSRNTIQRDGMSDGNLRFKCRPPVSMSLICNKSYSESKIRNMIAGVVYGHSLPDSGTPTSASSSGPSSDNVLALAPPPSTVPRQSRRPLHKHEEQEDRDRKMLLLQEREMAEHQQSFEEMNINGGHHHPLDDRRMSLAPSRRGSVQQHLIRHPSLTGPNSPLMDGDSSGMLQPSNQLQVPGSPLLEGEDSRRYRPYGNRSMAPAGASSHPLGKKLHHSHSHPNIGQHRHQQYLEQQEQLREHRSNSGYSPQAQQYHTHQQNQLQRQILRRESTHYHGSQHHARPDAFTDRRFSHPAALQPLPSSSSKHLPVGMNDSALSPAMSSSSRSSPGRESQHQSSPGEAGTPQMGLIPGPGGRYEEVGNTASYYQRRMSQPHPTSQVRSVSQLPPPPPGSSAHYYDQRASDVEDLNGHLREKYEKLHASTMRHQDSKSKQQIMCSPRMPYNQSSTPQSVRMPGSDSMRYSHSQSAGSDQGGRNMHQGQQASSGIYYQQPSTDLSHRELSPDEAEDRSYARVRQSFQRGGHDHSLIRSSSNPNLYSASMSSAASSKDLNSVLPRNTIKLTCFPNAASPTNLADTPPSTVALDTSNALALQLSKSSKVVIEITQPRGVQAFEHSPHASMVTAFSQTPGPLVRSIRHSASHPNLLVRSASSILGRRRSASPDEDEYDNYGASKKRRAEPLLSVRVDDEGDCTSPMTSASASAAAAEAAAAAVVAAAASAARRHNSNKEACLNTPAPGGLQIVGVDFSGNKADGHKEIGLGVQVPNCGSITSPALEALDVAKASSYTALEDQKELGIDYSQFTRVETAGWRILIPPNVVASFRSEDFGLVLKPKVEETEAEPLASEENEMEEAKKSAFESMEETDPQVNATDEAMEEDVTLAKQDVIEPRERQLTGAAQEAAIAQEAVAPENADIEAENEMDELEDD